MQHFIAACNANDVVPAFLKTGSYQPKGTIATISNAMDVGDPNNFVRILEIFEENVSELKRILSATSITDDETRAAIKRVYKEKGYIVDDETGKNEVTFTNVADRFDKTPLPKVWIDNIKGRLQKDEQLYFFDIVVKDKEGREFFAPELKITIK